MSADTGNRATLVHNIAFCLHALGEFDAAKAYYEQSLEGFKNVNVPFSTKADLEEYLAARVGRGPADRFLDPKVQHSGAVRLAHRTKRDIVQYPSRVEIIIDAASSTRVEGCQSYKSVSKIG